jgi:hypothetical protein
VASRQRGELSTSAEEEGTGADQQPAHNGVRTIIVETASRFARDLMVQEVGHAKLRERGIDLRAPRKIAPAADLCESRS